MNQKMPLFNFDIYSKRTSFFFNNQEKNNPNTNNNNNINININENIFSGVGPNISTSSI
jgi:hypothetical protein